MRKTFALALLALTLTSGVAALTTFAAAPARADGCPNGNC
jgi:hypothetical protein